MLFVVSAASGWILQNGRPRERAYRMVAGMSQMICHLSFALVTGKLRAPAPARRTINNLDRRVVSMSSEGIA